MAAAGQARELLAQLDEALAFEGPTREELEAELPAKVLVEHAVDTRKKQKWMCSQLHVVKFLLEFLDQRDSAPFDQKTTEAAVRSQMVQAKQQWKELKAGYQQRVEAIEGAVPCVLAQLEKGQHLAQRLKEALVQYEAQRHEAEKKARDARERRQKEQARGQPPRLLALGPKLTAKSYKGIASNQATQRRIKLKVRKSNVEIIQGDQN
ncbi:ZW10 interactor [Terrapene carolina triunguis]|uniref:ZW10 interactor n=1 Tax=Terrapene triunguis TaxID=2587831 RepID=UPI000E77714B|nr:ZW10 interactor [Terrapene carolina triunguis]